MIKIAITMRMVIMTITQIGTATAIGVMSILGWSSPGDVAGEILSKTGGLADTAPSKNRHTSSNSLWETSYEECSKSRRSFAIGESYAHPPTLWLCS